MLMKSDGTYGVPEFGFAECGQRIYNHQYVLPFLYKNAPSFDIIQYPPPQVYGFICSDVNVSGSGRAFKKRIQWTILLRVAFERLARVTFAYNSGQGGNQSKPEKAKPGKQDQPDTLKREGEKGSQRVKKLKKIK